MVGAVPGVSGVAVPEVFGQSSVSSKAVRADRSQRDGGTRPRAGGHDVDSGGEFSMGCDVTRSRSEGLPGTTRDALPVHRVYVGSLWMDAAEVTNEQFPKFVSATGYVTVGEQKPSKEEFPDAPPALAQLFRAALQFRRDISTAFE
jgi:hypothetical protein